MRKAIAICPFTKHEYALLPALSKIYHIKALISPKGIGMEGEDVSRLRSMGDIGFTFSNSVENSMKDVDVVLVTNAPTDNQALQEYAENALECAFRMGKEVVSFMHMSEFKKSQYLRKFEHKGLKCTFLDDFYDFQGCADTDGSLYPIKAPVVYFAELFQDCEGYDIFLDTFFYLKEQQVNVLALSDDVYNPLFGITKISFFEKQPIDRQLHYINNAVCELIKTQHPDVVLIRLPYPIMRFDTETPFDCGVSAYLISQAVPGDVAILCAPSGLSDTGFWQEIIETTRYKFGYPIMGVYISNQIIDKVSGASAHAIRVPPEKLTSEVQNMRDIMDIPIYKSGEKAVFQQVGDSIKMELIDIAYGVI